MTAPIERVTVVVPARDEQDLLPHCLDALDVAAARSAVPVDLVVVLDRCRDGTAEIVRGRGGVVPVVIDSGNVGRAHAAGAAAALRSGPDTPADRWWLATTDADSAVPPEWVMSQLALAADGWEVTVGTIDVTDWSGHSENTARRWAATYVAADHHPHVHGANLGMTMEAYLSAGGFPANATAEDVAMVAALAGRRIIRTAAHPVVTSARRASRTVNGFADHLCELAG